MRKKTAWYSARESPPEHSRFVCGASLTQNCSFVRAHATAVRTEVLISCYSIVHKEILCALCVASSLVLVCFYIHSNCVFEGQRDEVERKNYLAQYGRIRLQSHGFMIFLHFIDRAPRLVAPVAQSELQWASRSTCNAFCEWRSTFRGVATSRRPSARWLYWFHVLNSTSLIFDVYDLESCVPGICVCAKFLVFHKLPRAMRFPFTFLRK